MFPISSVYIPDKIRKLEKLVSGGHYNNVFIKYSSQDILSAYEVYNSLDVNEESKVAEYFYNHIAKRNKSGRLVESYDDRIVAISLYFGDGKIELANKFICSLVESETDIFMYILKGYGVSL